MHVTDISFLDEHQQYAAMRVTSHIVNFPEVNNLTPLILSANAGSGKTFILRMVCNALLRSGISFTVGAFTGRATSTLAREGLPNTSTLHGLLMRAVLDGNGDLLYFEDKPDNEVASSIGQALVIDEASMVPPDMYRRLSDICENYDIKLIFSGDIAQLPPIVPRDSPHFNVMDFREPDAEVLPLIINYRQKEGSAIADLAMHLREENSIPMKKASDLRIIRKSAINKREFHEKNQFDVILCGTNKMRKKLNGLVRSARGFQEEYPTEGEIIICKRNDVVNEKKINNGELYVVETRFPSSLTGAHDYMLTGLDNGLTVNVTIPDIAWDEEKQFGRKIGGKPVQQFSYGYAITVHSAQGSQFGDVLFVDEDVSFFLDQQKWRYTGVSRARDHLTIAR